MRRAGADFVFAPYNSTGHRMAQAIVRPHVQQFLDFTTRNIGFDVGIEQVQVGAPLRLLRKIAGRNGDPPRYRRHRAGHSQKQMARCCSTLRRKRRSSAATI